MTKRRVGKITLEQAKKRFNEYYDKRNKTVAGRRRAKLMDMMYQKKDSKVLVPNEPGSEKYMLDEGPRTFDMIGVDYFPEGENFEMETTQGIISGVSRGASFHKSDIDPEDSELSSPDFRGRRKSKKVYGPRLKKNNELYSSRFRRDLKSRQEKGVLKGNLVEKYWEDYKKGLHKRKNRKSKILPVSAKYFEGKQWKLVEVTGQDSELNGFYAVDFETFDVFRKVQNFVYDEDDKYIKIGNLNDENGLVSEEIYDILVNPEYGKLKDEIGVEEESCMCFFVQGENPNITYYTYDNFPITYTSEIYSLDAKGQDVLESGEEFFERLMNKTGKNEDRINNDIIITECEDDNHCLSKPNLDSDSEQSDSSDSDSGNSSDEQRDEQSDEEAEQSDEEAEQSDEEAEQSDEEPEQSDKEGKQSDEEAKQSDEEPEQSDEEAEQSDEEPEQSDKEAKQSDEEAEQSKEKAEQLNEEPEQSEEKAEQSEEEAEQSEEKAEQSEEKAEQSEEKAEQSDEEGKQSEEEGKQPDEEESSSDKKEKKQSPLIKELFDDEISVKSSVEPFSPKSKLSSESESESESEELSRDNTQKLTSYSVEKEEDIEYNIAFNNISEKMKKKLNINKISVDRVIENLNESEESLFLQNNITFVSTKFLKNLIENI